VIGYAIDVSHHQPSKGLPWDSKFAGKVQAVIARSSYGAELRDKECRAHVANARRIGARVGIYHFFRPIHSVQKQFDLVRSVADEVKLGPGDVVPALDIEADPFPQQTNVSPDWAGPVAELAWKLDDWFGARCMPYITQREFKMLGSPTWVLDGRALWVAYYPERDGKIRTAPPSPGNVLATMWQHRVDHFVYDGEPGVHPDKKQRVLDQNRILQPLPLLGPQPAVATVPVTTSQDSDDGLDDALLELVLTGEELDAIDAARFNLVGDLVRDGRREMSDLPPDTERAPQSLSDVDFDEPTLHDTPRSKSDPPVGGS
jgi:hypothetical protein